MEWLSNNQMEQGNVRLKASIFGYDNTSCNIIDMGALAEYSQEEVLLEPLRIDWWAKAGMRPDLDPKDPMMYIYN